MVVSIMLQYSSTEREILLNKIRTLGLKGFDYRDCSKPVKEESYINSEDYLLSIDPEFCSGIGNCIVDSGNNLGTVTTPNWDGIQWGLFFNKKTSLYILQINSSSSNLIKLLQKL